MINYETNKPKWYSVTNLSQLPYVQSYFFAWIGFLPGEEETPNLFHSDEDTLQSLL